MTIPRASSLTRWLIVSWGVLIFVWLGYEDRFVWPVAVLGAGTAGVILLAWAVSRYGGRTIPPRTLPLWSALVGGLLGAGGVLATVTLMLFKNVRHAHLVPDYPNELLAAMLARLPAWATAGAMIGAGAGLLLMIVYERKRNNVLSKTRIYFIRHGETDWNVERRFQGRSERDLNANGQRQIQAAAERIARLDETFSAIYASPQRRALQTAAPIADALGLSVQTDERLREIFCGEWEGLNGEQIEQDYPGQLMQWVTNIAEFTTPGGESMAEVQARMVAFVERVRREHRGEAVLAVSHGAALIGMTACLAGWDLNVAWQDPARRMENTGMIVAHFAADDDTAEPEIVRFNWFGDD